MFYFDEMKNDDPRLTASDVAWAQLLPRKGTPSLSATKRVAATPGKVATMQAKQWQA